MSLIFGTGGTPHSSHDPSSEAGIARISELGLGCMELEFVQGARMGEDTASRVRAASERFGIRLSAHGPYYVNLNAAEPSKIEASKERLLKAARVAWRCGAQDLVFHAAFYLDRSPDETYERVKRGVEELLRILRAEDNGIVLRPETTGKPSQFGTLPELLALSSELEGVLPCIDFAHLHARGGGNNTAAEWTSLLEQIGNSLGREGLERLHIHLAGIEYGPKGEKKHLNARDSDLAFPELLRVLAECGASGSVVCESPNLEEDALLFQKTYEQYRDQG